MNPIQISGIIPMLGRGRILCATIAMLRARTYPAKTRNGVALAVRGEVVLSNLSNSRRL